MASARLCISLSANNKGGCRGRERHAPRLLRELGRRVVKEENGTTLRNRCPKVEFTMDSSLPLAARRLSLLTLIWERQRPARQANEVRLQHEVAQTYPDLDYVALTKDVLAQISQERGVDFATSLFYDRVQRSPEHGKLRAALESLTPDLDA